MDLGGGLDKILEMGPRQEVPQQDELAVVFILDVDDAPAVLSTSNGASAHDDGVLGPYHGEGNEIFDTAVDRALLFVLLVIVVRIHSEVMESKFFPDPLFECHALFEGQ